VKWLLAILCFGDPTNGGGVIQSVHFPRLQTPLMQLVFVLVFILAGYWAWWLYQREASYVSPQRKRLLAGLRLGAWAVVLFILSGAYLELTRAEDAKGSILLLVDHSQSMSIADRRTEHADLAAVDKILGAAKPADPSKITRADLVKGAFANSALDPLEAIEKSYRVEAYTFGKAPTVTPLELQEPSADGGVLGNYSAPSEDATQLGSALLDAARKAKGHKVDAVVVVSDGGSNRGEDPVEAARQVGAPVYTIGVGPPQAKDIEIPFIYCEDVVFKNDRFPLNIRIKQRGYTGRQVTLHIKRIDDQRNEEIVKDQTIDFDDQLERMVTVDVLPDKEGVFTYVAEIDPFSDEADQLNNRRAKSGVKVVDKKIRVLMIDDSPRYVYRFVKSILEADPQRIAPTFLLRQGSDTPHGTHTTNHFPATDADMHAFDVVILGDVPADFFNAEELKVLENFVHKEGGGLVTIAGRNHFPSGYIGTPLAAMLPVEIESLQPPSVTEDEAHTLKIPFRPFITPEGARWAALRFAPEAAENDKDWQTCDGLFWFYPSRKVKPGASVLLAHPEHTMPDGAKMPILVSERYGKGQVLYFSSDEAWRWRFHPGAAEHRRLWEQMISALAMSRLLGSSDKAQIDTDRSEYAVGDRAQIIAHLLDNNYNPVVGDSVVATIERELSRETVTLSATKNQPGVFTGEWVPNAEGRFRLSVESGGDTADRSVSVVNPRIEYEDIGQHQELLQRMAAASNGGYLELEDIDQLSKVLNTKQQTANERHAERTLWNAPGVMIALVLFLGIEWFLRKRSDML
jgi:hypothetical protein